MTGRVWFGVRRLTLRDVVLLGLVSWMVFQHGVARVLADDAPSVGESRAPAGNAFTFQGRLDVDGVPANGSYDFEFRLFDASVAGSQVGALVTKTGVTVSNGLFATPLDFGGAAFNGEQRWVEVRARPASSGGFVLVGRQELTPTPYALVALNVAEHDHFGESWSGAFNGSALSISNSSGAALTTTSSKILDAGFKAFHSATTGCTGGGPVTPACLAIYAQADAPGSVAIEGTAPGTGVIGFSDTGTGVRGQGPTGVRGVSTGTSGVGVWGEATSFTGYGVRGDATSTGFAGVLGANTGTACTIQGASVTTYCIGVYGSGTAGDAGVGVYGIGSRVGIWGKASESDGFAAVLDGVTLTGHVYPIADNAYDLGGTSPVGFLAYRDIYYRGTLVDASDERLKTNIADLTSGLAEVLRLNPVSFQMRGDERGRTELGLIAQEVREVLPGVVYEGEDGMLSLSYVELIPILINAIKEQDARIVALEAQLVE